MGIEPKMHSLGQNIRTRRQALNLSRSNLAKVLGVETYVLRDMELKGSLPKDLYNLIPKLAKALNCSIDNLLGAETAKSGIVEIVMTIQRLSSELLHLIKDNDFSHSGQLSSTGSICKGQISHTTDSNAGNKNGADND